MHHGDIEKDLSIEAEHAEKALNYVIKNIENHMQQTTAALTLDIQKMEIN